MAVKFKHYQQEGSGGGTVEYAPYLTFQSGESFSMNVASPGWNNLMEYSTDTTTWSTWDGSLISAVQNSDAYVIYLRGTGNMKVSTSYDTKFSITGVNVKCIGNIENLLDYATVANGEHPPMMDYSYSNMFRDCTSLTTAPELPATTLTYNCYAYMFSDCTSLTTAPVLPAAVMHGACYKGMFSGCTSLTTAPELSATTLESSCYSAMFLGCTSLTTTPELPATTLAGYCYQEMFKGCTSFKVSTAQFRTYKYAWRIPTSGTISKTSTSWNYRTLSGTGGEYVDSLSINTTYYLENAPV